MMLCIEFVSITSHLYLRALSPRIIREAQPGLPGRADDG
jgi:hypothetical protein